MTFLSLAFLAALPLAAAPILLHLFDRRRQVVIEWGAMQFLTEAASRRTSARKLKQWLLLLLRTLAVAALVFALSRPLLPGGWLGSDERTETIFILDNSMSMTRSTGEGSLFDKAVARAIGDVSDLEPGDFVRVLLASPYPVWATTGSLRVDAASQRELDHQLRGLRATSGRSDLLSALFTAVQTEREPTQRRRRIVLLTDGQRSDWSIDDDGGWRRFRETLASAPMPTRLEIVSLDGAPKAAANVAVREVRSSRMMAGVNQPFRLTAHVENFGAAGSAPCAATWTVAGKDLHESHLPGLEAGARHDLTWRHSFSEPGVYAISCRVEAEDALAQDNQATVVVEVVNQAPVLLVEGAVDFAEIQQDSFFVQAALGWIDGEPLDEKAIYVPTLARPDELARIDLRRHRAVVIPNFTHLDKEAVEQLEQFVLAGGGLWISLGPRTDVEAFNQLLFADNNGLAPLAIDRIVADPSRPAEAEEAGARTKINPILAEHPATSALADHDQLDLGEIAIVQRFRFAPPPENEEASVLLTLTNGEPLAVEKHLGRGRVIVQSVPLRLQWSELARSQAFVVMVQDWLDYLAQPRATRHNLKPGEPIAIHLADAQSRQATLHTPHGDALELTADAAGDGIVFRSSRTILPGDYWLELGLSGNRVPFHVSREPLESQLAPLTASDQKLLAETAGLSRSLADASLSGTNQSEPVWPALLMALIGLMAAELLLSGRIARERFGAEPIAETTERWAAASAATSPAASGELVSADARIRSDREQETLTT